MYLNFFQRFMRGRFVLFFGSDRLEPGRYGKMRDEFVNKMQSFELFVKILANRYTIENKIFLANELNEERMHSVPHDFNRLRVPCIR